VAQDFPTAMLAVHVPLVLDALAVFSRRVPITLGFVVPLFLLVMLDVVAKLPAAFEPFLVPLGPWFLRRSGAGQQRRRSEAEQSHHLPAHICSSFR
jgi:hypothetical protein